MMKFQKHQCKEVLKENIYIYSHINDILLVVYNINDGALLYIMQKKIMHENNA